jgi:hypothetical protein
MKEIVCKIPILISRANSCVGLPGRGAAILSYKFMHWLWRIIAEQLEEPFFDRGTSCSILI